MRLTWIQESPPYWDADKARIVGGAGPGIFEPALTDHALGAMLPNDWWRVEASGKTVGYGWMDITWGDAEILLAVDLAARGHGVGTFILERLEAEARERGLHYIYNVVSGTHPLHDEVTQWLQARHFTASEDGKLLRTVVQRAAAQGFG
jgi:N-acetylglutamate synthase-like GNAT family acetyltransferase